MVATDVDYVDLGDVKRIEVEVRDTTGALANAGAVTLTITLPDATTTSPAVSNPSTGVYRVDYQPTMEGRHTWRMVATGANASAHTDVFDVRAAASPALVSLLAVKTHLNITTDLHDQELRGWIEATTSIIETHPVYGIGPVLPRTIVEDHDGGRAVIWLNQVPVILPLTSVVPVRTGGTAVTVGDLDTKTDTGKVQYLNGSTNFPSGPYRWTYRAGYTITPANVRGAALIIIKGLWETQRGASPLPIMGGPEVAEMPGMGLYMWRAKLLLDATPRTPVVA